MEESYTTQQAFEISAKHLLKQNARSLSASRGDYFVTSLKNVYDPTTICAYRGDDGLMCSVGVFLTDEEAKKFEGLSAGDNRVRRVLKEKYPLCDFDVFLTLQRIHDKTPPNDWPNKLKEAGDALSLDTSFIEGTSHDSNER